MAMPCGGRVLRAAAPLALAMAIAACQPIVTQHGYAPDPATLQTIEPGFDTAETVADKIGRPAISGVVRADDWFYVASTFEQRGPNAGQLAARRVVAISFDETGLVSDVAEYSMEAGRDITLVTRTTPTFGRQLTVIQQLFGNLGNVTAEGIAGGAGGILSPTPTPR